MGRVLANMVLSLYRFFAVLAGLIILSLTVFNVGSFFSQDNGNPHLADRLVNDWFPTILGLAFLVPNRKIPNRRTYRFFLIVLLVITSMALYLVFEGIRTVQSNGDPISDANVAFLCLYLLVMNYMACIDQYRKQSK